MYKYHFSFVFFYLILITLLFTYTLSIIFLGNFAVIHYDDFDLTCLQVLSDVFLYVLHRYLIPGAINYYCALFVMYKCHNLTRTGELLRYFFLYDCNDTDFGTVPRIFKTHSSIILMKLAISCNYLSNCILPMDYLAYLFHPCMLKYVAGGTKTAANICGSNKYG